MALTRTLEELRDEIRERGDLRSIRYSDDWLDRQINQSINELYRLLVSLNKDYYLTETTISVTSGTADYSLPSDFYKMLALDVLDSGKYYALKRFNLAERNQYQSGGAYKRNTRYRVIGSNIKLRPTPEWSGTCRLLYIPAPTELTADSDTFDGIAGWEEYVILDVIMKQKVRDEEDFREVYQQKKDLVWRIRSEARERDDGEPARIRDVTLEGASPGWPDYYNP